MTMYTALTPTYVIAHDTCTCFCGSCFVTFVWQRFDPKSWYKLFEFSFYLAYSISSKRTFCIRMPISQSFCICWNLVHKAVDYFHLVQQWRNFRRRNACSCFSAGKTSVMNVCVGAKKSIHEPMRLAGFQFLSFFCALKDSTLQIVLHCLFSYFYHAFTTLHSMNLYAFYMTGSKFSLCQAHSNNLKTQMLLSSFSAEFCFLLRYT